jgi:TonB family protein
MIPFILKSSISLIVLYSFYHYFLLKHKNFIFNRYYLLSSLVFSFIIPLIILPIKTNIPLKDIHPEFFIPIENQLQTNNTNIGINHISISNILILVWISVSSILLIRFIANIIRIKEKIRKCRKAYLHKVIFVLLEDKILPYSFLNYVFVNREEYVNKEIKDELILHERIHCSQLHSIDIIVVELLHIIFWFNPVIWIFRRAISVNHEFYTDERVMNDIGSDAINYPQLLLDVLLQKQNILLVNNFNCQSTKSRLVMMSIDRPNGNAFFRKLISITLFFVLGILLSSNKSIGIEKDAPLFSDLTSTLTNLNEPENLSPQFTKEETDEFYKTITYPEEAKSLGITGRVEVDFVINEQGAVIQADVTKSVHPLLDAEALRVVKDIHWKPDIISGKPNKSQRHIPITFSIK